METKLDLTYYPGEDFYSDGDIEDEMLEIAKNNPVSEFPGIIEEKKSWPIFYHFSPFRANIIDWIPFKKTDKVLEIGSGCGAITGAIARKAGSVTCIDLSKKRSLVNAYRNREYDNFKIMVGNFKDIEPHLDTDYDYVLLIGVFEYGKAYIGGDTPYEDFMRICNRHRKPDGRMVIAIENKFGLKYFAGCREDHLGTYYSGLEGYREGGSARTFTRHGLEKILRKTGINEYEFYYPYPDYKFMTTIYSDKYLPKKGELSNNLRNFDRERIISFDETLVFDQIIDEGEFPLFSNSYLLMIGKAPNVVYTKFSNDRADKWAIQTRMSVDSEGALRVEKHADNDKSISHIENMKHAYERLSARYKDTKIEVNKCETIDGSDIRHGLSFEYCKGHTLESMLDEKLLSSDMEGFKALIEEYIHWLGYKSSESQVSNYDFIFPNIIVDGDKWQVIDYEWTYDKFIEPEKIAFRAFYNYCLGGEARNGCKDFLMKDILGLSEETINDFIVKEREFQHRISGERASVDAMREIIGNRAIELEGLFKQNDFVEAKYSAQLYFDFGDGFSEINSVKIYDCYSEMKYLNIDYVIPKGVKRLRIDPCSFTCSVVIGKITVDNKEYKPIEIEINGMLQGEGIIVFATNDPNITINVNGETHLMAQMEVTELSQVLAKKLIEPKDSGVLDRIRGKVKRKC